MRYYRRMWLCARAGVLGGLLLGPGCVHRVQVVTDPIGASVSLGDRRLGLSPVNVVLPLFGPRTLTVQLAGYRTLTVPLGWKLSALASPPEPTGLPAAGPLRSATLELRLVREHGGVGTWDPATVE